MRPKKELIRVVRTPEGEVLVDATGKNRVAVFYLPQLAVFGDSSTGKTLKPGFGS